MKDLIITERRQQGVTVLDLAGQIRLGVGDVKLRSTLNLLVKEDKNDVLLNLAEVTHIDSSGLGELVAGYVSLKKNGGELKLLSLSSRVREIMGMVKLLTIFDVFEDEQQALESFSSKAEPNQSAIATGELDQEAIYQPNRIGSV